MPLDANSVPPQTAPHETRLADYQPPAFLIDTVELVALEFIPQGLRPVPARVRGRSWRGYLDDLVAHRCRP